MLPLTPQETSCKTFSTVKGRISTVVVTSVYSLRGEKGNNSEFPMVLCYVTGRFCKQIELNSKKKDYTEI